VAVAAGLAVVVVVGLAVVVVVGVAAAPAGGWDPIQRVAAARAVRESVLVISRWARRGRRALWGRRGRRG
jgi:hypothetical protein